MSLPRDLADVWEMRPKLRHDVVFLEAPSGAYLRGSDTAFLLKGRSAFRWLSTLSPYLTGQNSVGQLCGSLDEGQQRTVATLVRALVSRGFAKDAADGTEVPEPVARRFAGQIEFVDHFADDAAGRFLRFHTAHVVLGGAGPTLLAAASGLLSNGCARITLHPEDDPRPYRDVLGAAAEQFRAAGVPAEVQISTGPLDHTTADALVYCAEHGDLPRVLDLTRACQSAGPVFVPVVWSNGRAVLGPTTGRAASPCWLCAQLRLTASADPTVAADVWRQLALGPVVPGAGPVDTVAARMVGNAAAFEVFRALTGALPPDTSSSVVLLDVDTLESTRERLLAHPSCPVCRHSPSPSPAPVAAPETDEEVYQRAEILVSPHTGVFTRFVDDPLEQAPLKTARLRVPGPRDLSAFDVHTVMGARLAAYRLAVRDYLGGFADLDGAVTASAAELTRSGRTPVPWTALDTTSGALPYDPDRRLSWLPARVLGGDDATVWVPAALALPFSAANRDGYAERTVAGAAVGASVDAVVADGLASALGYHALVAAVRGGATLTPVPEADLTTDDDTALVVKAAHRFGRPYRLYALAGAAPAHAVLAVSESLDGDRPIWTTAAGLSAREARLAALRDLVGTIQVQHFEGAPADTGAPLLADFDPRTALRTTTEPATDGPAADPSVAEVLASLTPRGLTALLVDHTTPDIRATGSLVGGVVLLWRRTAGAAH
ncbi:TOMM precursor leader peptide-binding protein [Micromonospora sp. NPDC092111]|uniref:TOMM precursor leader peptide-binding protein n=1 Tax=Micromonospora sp. NPDC092111 TaxID=3364289 RepID=UPI00382FD578